MDFIRKAFFWLIVLAIGGAALLFAYHKIRPSETVENEHPSAIIDVVRRASNAGSDSQQWSTDKIREALAEFNSYFPVFHKAGFTVSEVRVEAGVFPSLTATFTQVKVITADEQADILREQRNKKILTYVLTSLFKVYGVNMGNYKLTNVDINISLTPSTTLVLAPLEDQSSASTPSAGSTPASGANSK